MNLGFGPCKTKFGGGGHLTGIWSVGMPKRLIKDHSNNVWFKWAQQFKTFDLISHRFHVKPLKRNRGAVEVCI